MQPITWLPISCALILLLNGCANNSGSSSNDPLGTGPFDSHGNYREEWANDPSKWRKPNSRSQPTANDEVPVVAKNEEPPPNANPLAPAGSSSLKIKPAQHAEDHTSTTSTHKSTTASRKASSAKPKSTATAHKSSTTDHAAHHPTKSKTKTSTPSKTSTTASKSKSKGKSIRYTVKKGDSMVAIAERYDSSMAEIKKANGLSGTKVRSGQTLVIPKH